MFDQIAIHAIATHLLAYDRSHVAVIDTTGSFSPVTLRDVILSKLDPGAGPSTPYVNVRHETEDEALPQKALQALDRVQIMRAFDFDGVFEAVQEVGTAPGSEASTGRGGGPAMRMAVLDGEEGALAEGALDNRQAQHRSTSVNPTLGMMEIPDSEAEDEEDDQEEGANPIRTAGHDDQRKSPHEAAVKAASSEDDGEGGASSVAKIGMIVIDTITNVVSSMVRASQVQGLHIALLFTPPSPFQSPRLLSVEHDTSKFLQMREIQSAPTALLLLACYTVKNEHPSTLLLSLSRTLPKPV